MGKLASGRNPQCNGMGKLASGRNLRCNCKTGKLASSLDPGEGDKAVGKLASGHNPRCNEGMGKPAIATTQGATARQGSWPAAVSLDYRQEAGQWPHLAQIVIIY